MRVMMLKVVAALALVLSVVGMGTTAGATAGATTTHAAPKTLRAWATYYGWYDNTPPGCATAYSGCAGGTGTYAHPITFASYKGEFPVGTILYYPTEEKYFRMGDLCQECRLDWVGKGPDGGPKLHHVDLWTGGKGGNEFSAINCEDALTEGRPDGKPLLTPFIENPPRGLPVSREDLFNAKTGHCFGGATTSTSTGRYRNASAGKCLADSSSRAGAVAKVATCGSTGTERIVYDGAFLVHGKLCLHAEGTTHSGRINWAKCNGGPREQWEVNPNGTLTWVQFTRCIADRSGRIVMTACTGKANEHWAFTGE